MGDTAKHSTNHYQGKRVAAIFGVQPPSWIWLTGEYSREPPVIELQANTEDFTVSLRLVASSVPSVHNEIQNRSSWPLELIEVRAERPLDIQLPIHPGAPVESDEQAIAFFGTLNDLMDEFSRAAVVILNRFLDYCRYILRNPKVATLSRFELLPPDGWEIDGIKVVWPVVYRGGGTMDSRATADDRRMIRKGEKEAIIQYLAHPSPRSLPQEILIDALGALEDGNLRRAVAEASLACEIAARETFLGGSPVGSATLAFLEDRRAFQVQVTDLIGSVSKAVFGRSFREEKPDDFAAIDHLFRSRNKAVHRGKPYFRDDAGVLVEVEKARLEGWFSSVDQLFQWLSELELTEHT